MNNKRFYLGKYVINIEWKEDEYADLSWLGKPTDQRGEYVVDRKEGVLLGPWAEFLVSVPASALGLTFHDFFFEEPYRRNGEPKDSAYRKAENALAPIIEAARIWWDDQWEVQFDDRDDTFYVQLEGYRILAKDLGHTYDRNEYRYFDVEVNHLPHRPDSWRHVDADTKLALIAKNGSLEQVDINYAVEDWKRWEEYGVYWWMMGCIVTVEDEDENELGYASLWGIEDDSDDSYLKEY